MNEKQMAERNQIVKLITGSHLYGTNTETSDKDYIGIFIADKEYYFGMKNIEEVSLNEVSKDEVGKNTKDAVDCKYYEIRQFFKLAFENNPNIIELLFSTEMNTIVSNDYFWHIIKNRNYFLSSEAIKKKFLAYAFSQKHKMIIKLENYDILKEAYNILEASDKKFLVDEVSFRIFEFRNNINTEFRVADLFIPRNISVKKAKEILQNRLGRVGNRQELVLKYGFDLKFAGHLLRLLLEGRELLQTKNLIFPLKERELILDIKKGKYKLDEILKMAEELEKEIELMQYKKFNNNYKTCNDLLVQIIINFLHNTGDL
jgi:uncharacterized protein